MRPSEMWQNVYSGMIMVIVIAALMGNVPALTILTDGAMGLAVLLGGVGLKMYKDVATDRNRRKYRGPEGPDGEAL